MSSTQAPSYLITRRHALLLMAAGAASLSRSHAMTSPFSFGLDIHGQSVYSLTGGRARVVATIFVATDCPISNRYLPEIARLARDLSPRGVVFWLVYPNRDDDLASVRAHQEQYPAAAELHQLIVPDPRFIHQAQVHVTPEAAVFSSAWPMSTPPLWHGRIDDRYLNFGQQRPAATRHDLADAIAAALAGRPPSTSPAPAIGCAIFSRA
jgi:hypothetical protein